MSMASVQIDGTDQRSLLDIAVQGAHEQGYQEGKEAGIEEASAFLPLFCDEGYREGWDAAHNAMARKLRTMARENPVARDILIELLG